MHFQFPLLQFFKVFLHFEDQTLTLGSFSYVYYVLLYVMYVMEEVLNSEWKWQTKENILRKKRIYESSSNCNCVSEKAFVNSKYTNVKYY